MADGGLFGDPWPLTVCDPWPLTVRDPAWRGVARCRVADGVVVPFDDEDEKNIRKFVGIAATHIENSQMYKGEDVAPVSEADAVFGSSAPRAGVRNRRSSVREIMEESEIVEEEEEEEDEEEEEED